MRLTDPVRVSDSAREEDQLVAQAIAGNPGAFATLYDTYVDRIYRFIFFRVGNEQTAEDLTSQVFLKAWENLGRYEIRGLAFGAWLFRVARNLVIDHYRTKKNTEPLGADGLDPGHSFDFDGHIDARLVADYLHAALHQLTDDQRTVLTLKFIEGWSTAEIADMMGKRQGAVRALQLRGLKALAEILERDDE